MIRTKSALSSVDLRRGGIPVEGATPTPPSPDEELKQAPYRQASREGQKGITFHFPKEVSAQLRKLAAEEDRLMLDLGAEAMNLLFAKYGRPEIAPRKKA